MNTRVHNLQTADKQKDLTGTIQTRLAERGAASRRRTARPVRKKRGSKAPVLAHQSPPLAATLTDRTVEKTIRGLETIKSQGQNLIYFTTSYRQISGLKQPEFKDFPLARLIENVRTLYQEDLQRQHIDFRADLFQPEIQIRADEKMLSQVLINLLKNAMQAVAERPEKRIRLKAYRQGARLLVEITDNGPGIPSHSLEDIFIPFFTTKPNGTGIGLSLSRQIVRLHGGELSVSSQPFHETSFTVSLPLGHSPGPFRPAGTTA